MTNNVQSKSVLIATAKNEQGKEFKVTVKLEAEQGKEIARVHAVKTRAKITSKDFVENLTKVSGGVDVVALYETVDVEFSIAKQDGLFSDELQTVGTNNLIVRAIAKEYEVVSFDESSIVVNVLVQTTVTSILSEEVGKEFDEVAGLVLNKESVTVSKVLATSVASFSCGSEVAATFSDNAKVVFRDAEVILRSAVASVDVVILEGSVFFSAFVWDDGKLQEVKHREDFKQEVDCFGANPGAVVSALASVSDVMAGVAMSEGSGVLSFSAEILNEQIVFMEEEIVTTRDAYSVIDETVLALECAGFVSTQQAMHTSSDISLSVSTADRLGVDEVLGVLCPTIYTSKVEILNGNGLVEGVVELTVCYKNNMDENIQTFSGSVPFVASFEDLDNFNTIDDFRIVIKSFKLKAGASVEIDAELFARATKQEQQQIMYVSDIEFSQKEKQENAAIKIYTVSDGDRIFDIAKHLGVTVETLVAQNPELEKGVVAGERVFVYIPLVVNF